MKRFRKLIFWLHLATGLSMGLVVLIMSVTGVLLTYQRQITAWADTRGLDAGPPRPGARPLPAEELLARARAAGGGEPTSITWHADPTRPVEVGFGRQRTLFLNAYTGEVLGEGNAAVRKFFSAVMSWHRWLGAEGERRAVGKAITGAANLGFLFLVLSGFYLWWPQNRTRKAFRNVLFFRRGLSGKARDFNWHNVIGIWALIPLAVVVASGVVISYPWASDLVYRLAGDTPPPAGARGPGGPPSPGGPGRVSGGGERGGAGGEGRALAPGRGSGRGEPAGGPGREAAEPVSLAGVDPLLRRAALEVAGWRTISLSLSAVSPEAVTFTIDRGNGGQPHKRSQVTLDRSTGEVVRKETFADNSPGRRARSILRFAHTGEVAGIVGQTVAGLVSAGAVVLVWTGFALAWRRFRAWWRRTQPDARAASPGEAELEEAVTV